MSIAQGHTVGASLPLGRKRSTGYDEMEGDDFENTPDLQSLPTDFCDWCCEYFANPLTKVRLLYLVSIIMIATCLQPP